MIRRAAVPMFLLALAAAGPAHAQAQPAAAAEAATPAGEPNVRTIVSEDKGSRIEELRVRGQTQRIVVTPKVGTTQPYEIITGDGGRDPSFSAGNSKGAAGQRVWNVLKF